MPTLLHNSAVYIGLWLGLPSCLSTLLGVMQVCCCILFAWSQRPVCRAINGVWSSISTCWCIHNRKNALCVQRGMFAVSTTTSANVSTQWRNVSHHTHHEHLVLSMGRTVLFAKLACDSSQLLCSVFCMCIEYGYVKLTVSFVIRWSLWTYGYCKVCVWVLLKPLFSCHCGICSLLQPNFSAFVYIR